MQITNQFILQISSFFKSVHLRDFFLNLVTGFEVFIGLCSCSLLCFSVWVSLSALMVFGLTLKPSPRWKATKHSLLKNVVVLYIKSKNWLHSYRYIQAKFMNIQEHCSKSIKLSQWKCIKKKKLSRIWVISFNIVYKT